MSYSTGNPSFTSASRGFMIGMPSNDCRETKSSSPLTMASVCEPAAAASTRRSLRSRSAGGGEIFGVGCPFDVFSQAAGQCFGG